MTEIECRKVLELPENYSLKDAKQAYRRLVLRTHPDRNNGDNSKFILVNKAFDEIQKYILSPSKTHISHHTKVTYNYRKQADNAYKTRIKDEIFWKRYNEARRKKHNSDFKENLKLGILIVVIIMLLCIVFGKDPEEYTRRNSYQSEYE